MPRTCRSRFATTAAWSDQAGHLLRPRFNSSKATWDPLQTLLERDPVITAEFDRHTFSYETALGALPVVRRLPTLDEAGKSLAAMLTAELLGPNGQERYIDMTLVGHSMGGLIIQNALLDVMTPAGSTRTLDHIRQVILCGRHFHAARRDDRRRHGVGVLGKPDYVSEFPASRQLGAVRRTYLDFLADRQQALGPDFVRAYDASTDPVPDSLVIDDVRRDDVVGT